MHRQSLLNRHHLLGKRMQVRSLKHAQASQQVQSLDRPRAPSYFSAVPFKCKGAGGGITIPTPPADRSTTLRRCCGCPISPSGPDFPRTEWGRETSRIRMNRVHSCATGSNPQLAPCRPCCMMQNSTLGSCPASCQRHCNSACGFVEGGSRTFIPSFFHTRLLLLRRAALGPLGSLHLLQRAPLQRWRQLPHPAPAASGMHAAPAWSTYRAILY